MQGYTEMGNVGDLPESIQIIATVLIAVITGVATLLGWSNKAAKSPAKQEVEIAGAVVDSRAVKTLVDQIDFAVDRFTNLHEDRMRIEKQSVEELASLRKDIREMTNAVDKLIHHNNERRGIYG